MGDEGDAPYAGYASAWFDDVATATAHAPALRTAGVTAQIVATELIQRDTPARPDMVKAIFFFHRKPGTTPEAFRDIGWRPTARWRWRTSRTCGATSRTTPSTRSTRTARPDLDGLVEAWVDSMAALTETEATAEHAFVRSDEPNFLDTDRVTFMPVTERRVR